MQDIIKFQYSRVVNKPNKIIQASQNMTTIQQKMFFSALSQVKYKILNSRENDIQSIADTTYTIPIEEVLANFEKQNYHGGKGSDLYNHIDNSMKELVRQVISVRNVEKDTHSVYNIIRYAEWQSGNKNIEVKFSLDVIPILIDMVKEGYTRLSLENIFPLKNVHSIRIYEEIMRFVTLNRNKKRINVKEYIISYHDLRFLLGMNTSKEYKLFADFRRFVLHPVQREILLYTNLSFEIEEIREKNKVKYIRFFDITVKNEQLELPLFDENNIKKDFEEEQIEKIQIKEEKEKQEIIVEKTKTKEGQKFTGEELEKLEIYLKDVFSHKEIKEKYDFDYIEFYYKKVKEIEAKGLAKNFAGLLYDMLITDKFNFKEFKVREEIKRKKEIAAKKEFEEKELSEKERAKREKEENEREHNRLESIFDSIPKDVKEELLEKLYAENPFYKTEDGKIWNPTKWAVVKMYENTKN